MERYKPGYLGKVIPADNQSKLTEFVTKKMDAFNKVYDSCKTHSESIQDIKPVENDDSNSLSVKVATDAETLAAIATDESVSVDGNVVTANS